MVDYERDRSWKALRRGGAGRESTRVRIALAVRLQPGSGPDALYGRVAHVQLSGHGTGRPTLSTRWSFLEGLAQDEVGKLFAFGEFATAPRRILRDSCQAFLCKTTPPSANSHGRDSKFPCDGRIELALGGQQDDAGPLDEPEGRASTSCPLFQRCAFVITQNDGWSSSHFIPMGCRTSVDRP